MDDSVSLVLPNAALRALAQSVLSDAPGERYIELSIRAKTSDVNVRELSGYLSLLDGVYGRLDPQGFRSYVQQPVRQLRINEIRSGSVELDFLTELLRQDEVWRLLMVYIVARIAPDFLRGDVAKNWAEAAKAGIDTYTSYKSLRENIPPDLRDRSLVLPARPDAPVGELPAVREEFSVPVRLTRKQEQQFREADQDTTFQLTKKQWKQISDFMRDDPNFSKLGDRHRRKVIHLVEDVLARERHHLPAAIRFSQKYVVEVSVRVRSDV